MHVVRAVRRRIQRLGRYPSLLLVAVPLAVVEPLKLAVIFIAGAGHWVTGLIALLCAYAVSLFVAHWIFGIVKPKLLTFRWFAVGWRWFVRTRRTVFNWLRMKWLRQRPARRVGVR
jgi:hypothetical protein